MIAAVKVANTWWIGGWLLSVAVLTGIGFGLPLRIQRGRLKGRSFGWAVMACAVVAAILANIALALHDLHFDVTIEKTHTPAAAALETVDVLDRPVKLTYFYQGQDESALRAREVLELMGRRNPLLSVETLDPDLKPAIASRYGTRMYNSAVLEAEGRRIVVPSVDENDIAVGIQRVLRRRVVPACFIDGHGEYPVDNYEFHTHLEGLHDHNHSDASSKVIETTGHGIGRLRRVLEDLGYEIRRITPATQGIAADCALVVSANPRNAWLPEESIALERYLDGGGAALLMFDLGFPIEAQLGRLLGRLGVAIDQAVIVDPRSHYGNDPQMVAVTGYDAHPVTRSVSLTLFPGARPLQITEPAAGLSVMSIVSSAAESVSEAISETDSLSQRPGSVAVRAAVAAKGPRTIAAAIEGKIGNAPTRVIVTGDADFASNSFLPYMANKDLAVSMVRWLAREEKLSSASPRIPTPTLVLLTQGQMQRIFLLVEVLPPLCVLALGAFVWWRRR